MNSTMKTAIAVMVVIVAVSISVSMISVEAVASDNQSEYQTQDDLSVPTSFDGVQEFEDTADGQETDSADNVAEVNGAQYTTLKDALDNSEDGDLVEILKDFSFNETVTIPKGVNLKFNDYTVTYNGTGPAFNITGTTLINLNNNLDIPPCEGGVTHTGNGPIFYLLSSCNYFVIDAGTFKTSGPLASFETHPSPTQGQSAPLQIDGGYFEFGSEFLSNSGDGRACELTGGTFKGTDVETQLEKHLGIVNDLEQDGEVWNVVNVVVA